ncbi:MAG TPA: heat-inducible transcription repressor HrcA [Thiotrichales bacterium]|nr:heat-inducible transcription repressor HrcA [Thiotrichales bacterium]
MLIRLARNRRPITADRQQPSILKPTPIISERAQVLLKQLVASYISDGQPVGSKQLAQDANLNISSATIRNVMSDLEKKGLVKAPHTSAGRVPTEQGLRLFVENFLEIQPIEKKLLSKMQHQLDPDQDAEGLINQASQLVSELTHMAGIITVPKTEQFVLRHIEFLPLPDRRVLAILVLNEKDVQNKVLHLNREYSADELLSAANFLNQQYSGQDVESIRGSLLSDLDQTRADVDIAMRVAVDVAGKALDTDAGSNDPALIVQGETNLVRYNETSDPAQLQQLFELFDRKRELLGLFDRCVDSEGVKIFIGSDAGFEGLGDCSVITSTYSVDNKTLGVLGVVGPARMNYDHIIPVVDVTARLLGDALKF